MSARAQGVSRRWNPELAVLRESDASYYLREERMGYILGPYEIGARQSLQRVFRQHLKKICSRAIWID